jgi:hypothetical protein
VCIPVPRADTKKIDVPQIAMASLHNTVFPETFPLILLKLTKNCYKKSFTFTKSQTFSYFFLQYSVADPGSGAILPSGSGMEQWSDPG